MPTFTSSNGATVHYNDTAITMVWGPKSTDNSSTTYVFGLESGSVMVSAAPATFVSGLANTSNFVSLTQDVPSRTVYVNALAVAAVRTLTTGEALNHPTAGAVIYIIDPAQDAYFVTSSAATVVSSVNSAGGNV